VTLLVNERVAILAAATADLGHQEVLFDRDDTDSYRIQMATLRSDREQLTRSEVMPALPVGSRWEDALGWESYVLFPIKRSIRCNDLVIIGIEYAVQHVSRGAYAIFGGVVVPASQACHVANAIADVLHAPEVTPPSSAYGIVISDARTLKQHRRTAAWILRAAGIAYAEGKAQFVRTLLLTQDEVPRARDLLPGRARNLLLGVAPPLRDRFSRSSNVMLGLGQSKSFSNET
jgi:hypothetical protein